VIITTFSSILGIFYHGVFDYFFGMSDHLLLFNYLIIKHFSYIIRAMTWDNIVQYL